LFLGTHGQENWGDEILLETFLKNLGKENHYFINSYNPEKTLKRVLELGFSAETFHTTKDKIKLLKFIWKSDLIFFGGGSIIKELNKALKRNKYSSMFMVLFLVFFGKVFAGKKIIMSNIGIGPIKTKFGRFLARLILFFVDKATLRDKKSFDLAKSFGVSESKISVVPDAVFSLEPEYFGKLQKSKKDKKVRIGLNLNYHIENLDNWNYFIENLKEVFFNLSEKVQIKLVGVPMQTGFSRHDDIKTISQFFSLLPESIEKETPEIKSAQDLANTISSCDIVLGERLHSLIIAAILGVPVFAMIYDVKVESLVKEWLFLDEFSVNINEKFDKEKLEKGLLLLTERKSYESERLKKISFDLFEKNLDYFRVLKKRFIY